MPAHYAVQTGGVVRSLLGLVYLPLWRPDGAPPDLQEASRTGMFGGVGRKGSGGPP
jgi:hypothetical protein